MRRLIAPQVCTRVPPQPLPATQFAFPDPRPYGEDGFIGFGGDFAPETIVAAYRAGIFPWPHGSDELLWFSPDPRAVIPIGGLHVSRRLQRTLRQGRFQVSVDVAFLRVIHACAEREEGTWITPGIITAYSRLHELGWAHSFEVWSGNGELVGGLYGLAAGAMFGAESMFHRVADASKIAMVAMMEHATEIGLELIDIQILTGHTARMGAIEISRVEYLRRLSDALQRTASWLPRRD